MSISSSDFFIGDRIKAQVQEKKNCIEIFFNTVVPEYTNTSTSSTSVSVVGTYSMAAGVVSRNGSTFSRAGTSSDSSHIIYGFKLFVEGGFLKCVKREVSHMQIIASGNTAGYETSQAIPVKTQRHTLCSPNEVVGFMSDGFSMQHIEKLAIALALRKGVAVPESFKSAGAHYDPKTREWNNFYSSIDWLSHPLIREIHNVDFCCKNLRRIDRNLISPDGKSMNFKDLVQHYYGASTSKMLEELWGILIRDNKLNTLVFTVGPAVFSTMGFDYLYQVIPKLGNSPETSDMQNLVDQGYTSTATLKSLFGTLLKHITPKKLLSLITDSFGIGTRMDALHEVSDLCRMLSEFDRGDKIPPALKLQYPRGLVIDFKFKTMKEAHDKVSSQYTIIKAEADKKEIPVHDLYMMLHGRERNGCKLVVPTNTSFLSIWGKELGICVASYGDRAARADTLILGVEKDGQIKYCIEFRPLILARSKDDLRGLICKEFSSSPTMEEVKIERVAIPMLEEKHMGVTPTDVDKDTYTTLYITQFRGHRNGDPDNVDRGTVDRMLTEWMEENKDEYDKHGDKAFGNNFWKSDQGGRPDQLIMNPAQYQAVHNALVQPADPV